MSQPAEYKVDENVSVEKNKLKIVGQVVSGILMTFLTPLSHHKHLQLFFREIFDKIDTEFFTHLHPQRD